MSIKTTLDIKREDAIERINKITALILCKNYREIEELSYEPYYHVQHFVDSGVTYDISNIEKWTNRMLEDVMDRPFYRYSMFDNYYVI